MPADLTGPSRDDAADAEAEAERQQTIGDPVRQQHGVAEQQFTKAGEALTARLNWLDIVIRRLNDGMSSLGSSRRAFDPQIVEAAPTSAGEGRQRTRARAGVNAGGWCMDWVSLGQQQECRYGDRCADACPGNDLEHGVILQADP
jgi:hypothetical protein